MSILSPDEGGGKDVTLLRLFSDAICIFDFEVDKYELMALAQIGGEYLFGESYAREVEERGTMTFVFVGYIELFSSAYLYDR